VTKPYRDKLGCAVIVCLASAILGFLALYVAWAIEYVMKHDPISFLVGVCIPLAILAAKNLVRSIVKAVRELW